nr:MAG TPA: hypothetical protein [Inoviridae sp.]
MVQSLLLCMFHKIFIKCLQIYVPVLSFNPKLIFY